MYVTGNPPIQLFRYEDVLQMLVVSVLESDPQVNPHKDLIVNMLIIGHRLNSSGAALQCIHHW